MRTNRTWPLLAAIILMFAFAQCKKEKQLTELEKLPPATQTGANTLGCLVNGKAWVAQTDCKFLCNPKVTITYSSQVGGGVSIHAKSENNATDLDQSIVISFDSALFKTYHPYQDTIHTKYGFFDYANRPCRELLSIESGTTAANGSVSITRQDLTNRIISGTFEFWLKKQQCDSLIVKDGRFDIQF